MKILLLWTWIHFKCFLKSSLQGSQRATDMLLSRGNMASGWVATDCGTQASGHSTSAFSSPIPTGFQSARTQACLHVHCSKKHWAGAWQKSNEGMTRQKQMLESHTLTGPPGRTPTQSSLPPGRGGERRPLLSCTDTSEGWKTADLGHSLC